MRKKSLFLTIIFLIYFISTAIIYYFDLGENNDLIENIFYIMAPALSFISALYLSFIYGLKSKNGLTVIFITIGLFLFFLADSLWIIYDYFLEIPANSNLPEIIFVFGYPLIFAGILQQITNAKITTSKIQKIIFFIFALAIMLINSYILCVILFDYGNSQLDTIINAAINFGNILLLLSGITLVLLVKEYRGGKLFWPWLIFFFGIITTYLGDTLHAIYTEEYENYVIFFTGIDLLWIAGYLFFAYALFNIGFTIKNILTKIIQK